MTPAITSHMKAHLLFQKRARGKPSKKINGYLWLQKDGENFTVTNKGGSVPIITIARDDTATIHFNQARQYLGWCSVVSHMRRYFAIYIHHKKDRRSSQQWWYSHNGQSYPLVDDMRVHLPSGVPLDPPAVIQRRRVRRDVAKPIREKIADWEKLARSYLTLADNFQSGMLKGVKAELPAFDSEPTVDDLMKMISYGAERGGYRSWALFQVSSWRGHDKEELRRAAQRAFKNAFEKWKEELYTKHGVFTWVDKAA